MIVECSITNFGPIRDTQTLSMVAKKDSTLEDYYVVNTGGLRLLKIALLYGPNASGKTSILKALDCLRTLAIAPNRKKSDILGVYPFFDDVSLRKPTVFRIVFIQNNIRYDYTVELTNQCVLREQMMHYPHGRPAQLFSRETDTHGQLAILKVGTRSGLSTKDLTILEGNTLWNNTVLGGFVKSNVNWPELLQVQQWFTDTLEGMISPADDLRDFANVVFELDPDHRALMASFMKKADVQIEGIYIEKREDDSINPEITVIFPQNSSVLLEDKVVKWIAKNAKLTERTLMFVHKIKQKEGADDLSISLPWNHESHGTQRYYGLSAILTLLIRRSKINLIDELDSGLHPDLVKHFLLSFLANAQQSQMICSTHNLRLLDEEDVLRRDVIWFTQKRVDGSTELYSLSDFEGKLSKKKISISDAYHTGKLGATPDTGSIFIEDPA